MWCGRGGVCVAGRLACVCRRVCTRTGRTYGRLYSITGLGRNDVIMVNYSSDRITNKAVKRGSDLRATRTIFGNVCRILYREGVCLTTRYYRRLGHTVVIRQRTIPGTRVIGIIPRPGTNNSFTAATCGAFGSPITLRRVGTSTNLSVNKALVNVRLGEITMPMELNVSRVKRTVLLTTEAHPGFVNNYHTICSSDFWFCCG